MSKLKPCIDPKSNAARPIKPKAKVTRWKPFHSWLNGKPKAPIALGLTVAEAAFIANALEYMEAVAIASGARLHFSLASQNRKCIRMLERRNLKPLRDTECGAIRSKADQ